ncbi:hypothetical protein ACERII_16930 [Evansella sp. AB-rgal1]|uniref:hypothetical protein n=1 Tax=Evansella sp. AB-rgal1 TaxID=3242696 RepID=UPI00359DC7B7
MINFMISTAVILFLLAIGILFSSRPFMYGILRWKTERKLKKFHANLKDVHFSFEEITYFVPLPNRTPLLAEASMENIVTEPDFASFIFPEIKGLKIYVRKNKLEQLIAYISIDHFRLPYIDKLLYEKKINEQEYLEMSGYILLHPNTKKAFIEEIYRQMRVNTGNDSQ